MRDLRVRFGAVLGLALLPLLVFSVWQSYYDYKREVEAEATSLVLSARQSTEKALNSLEHARSALRTLQTTLASEENCDLALSEVLAKFDNFDQLFVAAPDGTYICATDSVAERTQTFKSADQLTPGNPFLLTRRSILDPLDVEAESSSSRVRVSYGGFKDGVLDRIFIVDLSPQQLALGEISDRIGGKDVEIAIFNDRAEALIGAKMQNAPARIEWIEKAQEAGEFRSRYVDQRGKKRDLIVLQGDTDDFFIAFSQPHQGIISWNVLNPFSSAIVPILAWVFGFGAIWVATDRLILGHLRRMRLSLVRFARGDYSARIGDLRNPPHSIRELSRTMDLMADKISSREAELEDSLAQKEMLLREIHHRVKNNLQVIISLLNMQERKMKDKNGLAAINETRSRINAIALVHRGLYEGDDLRYIDMEVFLGRLTHELGFALGADKLGIDIHTQSNCEPLEADTATPVALFVVEALTNSIKHGVSGGGTVHISLTQDKTNICIQVQDSGAGFDGAGKHEGMGSKLIRGFARQLSGTIDEANTGEGYVISLSFKHRPYSNPI